MRSIMLHEACPGFLSRRWGRGGGKQAKAKGGGQGEHLSSLALAYPTLDMLGILFYM